MYVHASTSLTVVNVSAMRKKMGVCNSEGFEVRHELTYSLGIDFCPYNRDVRISGVSARRGSTVPKKAQETRTGMSQNHMRLDIRIAWCVQHPHTCITQCNSYYSRICFKAMVIVLQLVLYENAQQYRALMMIVQSYCQRSGGSTTSHQFLLQHM
jgi:hypothetical protein